MGGKETLAEKGGVDAVRLVAFAYDIYTNPSKNNGVLRATLTQKMQIKTTLGEPVEYQLLNLPHYLAWRTPALVSTLVSSGTRVGFSTLRQS